MNKNVKYFRYLKIFQIIIIYILIYEPFANCTISNKLVVFSARAKEKFLECLQKNLNEFFFVCEKKYILDMRIEPELKSNRNKKNVGDLNLVIWRRKNLSLLPWSVFLR